MLQPGTGGSSFLGFSKGQFITDRRAGRIGGQDQGFRDQTQGRQLSVKVNRMLSWLFFFGQVMVLAKGISQPEIRPVCKLVWQVNRINNFLKFNIDKAGIPNR